MKLAHRDDIDGLRAVAVIAVIIFHYSPNYMPGGFVGVDIFFVISGFVITNSILAGIDASRFTILGFYERRIVRIFPALLAVLSAAIIAGWVLLYAVEYVEVGKHVAGASAFLSNILLFAESGYFDTAALKKPLLHLWSLGIEEQFYIVWPLLLILTRGKRLAVLWLVGSICVVSFIFNLYETQRDASAAFYLPFGRFWELGLGALLSAMSPLTIRPIVRNAASMAGAAFIAFAVTMTPEKSFPGIWALPATLGAVLLILAGPEAALNRHVLSRRSAVGIGLISYPLYLWHWPILSFASIVNGEMPSRAVRGAALLASFALATGTYLLIEKPIRFGALRRSAPLPLIGSLVTAAAVGIMIFQTGGVPGRVANANAEPFSQFVGPLWKWTANDNCLSRYKIEGQSDLRWWFCVANSTKPANILIIGTSHANQIYPGLAENPELAGHHILNIGTCDPFYLAPAYAAALEPINPCSSKPYKQQRDLIDRIVTEDSPKLIIAVPALQTTPEYIHAAQERISFFEAHGAKVIIYTPYVRLNGDIRSCFPRRFFPAGDCHIPASAKHGMEEYFLPFVTAISRSNPNVRFFNSNQMFCDDDRCSVIKDKMPLLRDEFQHWSEYGSKISGRMFVDWAKANSISLDGKDSHSANLK